MQKTQKKRKKKKSYLKFTVSKAEKIKKNK
jgi:hypothetical protein